MTTAVRSATPFPRTLLLALIGLLAASGILLATARPVAACSCAGPQTMKDYANPDSAVFSGTAGAREKRGVPVTVDQWFWGRGGAPVVWLASASFGDGAACGTNPPPAGSAWIWVAWLPAEGGDPMTGLCSPSGDLSTPEGKKMLAEATDVFSGLAPPATPAPTDAPEAVATPPAEAVQPDPAAIARDQATLTIALALGGVVVVLFGGLVLLARRPSRPTDRP